MKWWKIILFWIWILGTAFFLFVDEPSRALGVSLIFVGIFFPYKSPSKFFDTFKNPNKIVMALLIILTVISLQSLHASKKAIEAAEDAVHAAESASDEAGEAKDAAEEANNTCENLQ